MTELSQGVIGQMTQNVQVISKKYFPCTVSKMRMWEFLAGPVVRTPRFHCGRCRFDRSWAAAEGPAPYCQVMLRKVVQTSTVEKLDNNMGKDGGK